jgi:hypothetical protein
MDARMQTVEHFLTNIKEFLAAFPDSEVQPYKPLLDDWGSERADLPAERIPVVDQLDKTLSLTSPKTEKLTKYLVQHKNELNWRRSFTETDASGADFPNRYGWTEIIGNKGPLVSTKVRCGFVIWAANTYYPPHAHEAEELYIVLAGTGEWERGDEGPMMRPPGSVFLHTSQMFHATKAFDEPVLAMYCWRGANNLLEKPHFSDTCRTKRASVPRV